MPSPAAARRILIAPLDWGLGHTTRCVPLIRHLLAMGCEAVLAGTETQLAYYAGTFAADLPGTAPRVALRQLPGYNVRYAKTGAGFLPRLLRQGPRILATVRDERAWLANLLASERIDGVISDNRYGLHHPSVPCVVLTHQLSPRSGMGNPVDAVVRRAHYRLLSRFGECWLVDTPTAPGLSGAMAHPPRLPPWARYIGLLSQFAEADLEEKIRPVSNDPLLILLSGPEPQRTILSRKLWAQAQHYRGPVIFIEGREDAPSPANIPPHITHYGRLTADALKPLLQAASTVICRSGYSSLMDLVALRKRAIVIPTPGQTEQAYLAQMLHDAGIFYAASQKDFSLERAVRRAAEFPFRLPEKSGAFRQFMPVLEDWIGKL